MTLLKSFRVLGFVVIATLFTATLIPTQIYAAADLGIKAGEQQQSIQKIVRPGEEFESYVEIVNTGNAEGTGNIMIKDFVRNSDGAATVISNNQPNQSTGTWIQVVNPTVTVPAGKIQRVNLKGKVPQNTAPGEYAAGVVLTETQPQDPDSNIQLVSREVVLLMIVVPDSKVNTIGNKVTGITSTTDASTKKLSGIQLTLRDEGNLFTESRISVALTRPNGQREGRLSQVNENSKSVDLPDGESACSLVDVCRFLSPEKKDANVPLNFKYAEWENGNNYKLVVELANKPTHRLLTSKDYQAKILTQRVVFNFDVIDGSVQNVKEVENIIVDGRKNSDNDIMNFVLIGIVVLALLGTVLMMIMNMKKNKKVGSKSLSKSQRSTVTPSTKKKVIKKKK